MINSPIGKDSMHDDSYLRKNAIKYHVPYVTTMAMGKAAAEGIHHMKTQGNGQIKSIQ